MADVERERGWCWGCMCGTSFVVRRAELVRVGDGCTTCAEWDLTVDINSGGGDPIDSMVVRELGWCCCGIAAEVDVWMIDYLESLAGGCDYKRRDVNLLAYMADDLGWTEHGGALPSGWLTDEGTQALANLKVAVARAEVTSDRP